MLARAPIATTPIAVHPAAFPWTTTWALAERAVLRGAVALVAAIRGLPDTAPALRGKADVRPR